MQAIDEWTFAILKYFSAADISKKSIAQRKK
jgi:hypothetical protein